MFVQVFQGRVRDADRLEEALVEWVERLAPQTDGWLGTTAGVADGVFVGVARFASAEAAQRSSGRPEQGEWWRSTAELFAGDIVFHNCGEVLLAHGGGSDEAGFVQVIQGRGTDIARLRDLGEEFESRFPDVRPDLLGFFVAFHDDEDGAFTEVAYFTSEEAARDGEQQEPPPGALELVQEEMSLMHDLSYVDLARPWLLSPA